MDYSRGISDFRNMEWLTKCGEEGNETYDPIRIKNMDTNHILTTMRMVRYNKGSDICGYSTKVWEIAFKKELEYRDRMGNAVLRQFPIFYKQYRKIITTDINKSKNFTTKGILSY